MTKEQLYAEIEKIPWEMDKEYRPAIFRKVPKDLYNEYLPFAEQTSKVICKCPLYTREVLIWDKKKWVPYKELFWFGTSLGCLEPV